MLRKFLFKRILKYFSDKVNSDLSQLLISRTSSSHILWAEEEYCDLLLHVQCQSLIHQQVIGGVESTRMDPSEGLTGTNSITGRNRTFLGFQGRVDTL